MPSPLDAMAERTEDIVEWRVLRRRYLALRHPDHIEHVLVAGHDRYVKAAHYRLLAAVTGEGLLTNEGESWAHQRRLIQPLLGRRQLDGLGAHMTAAATAHLARWDALADGDEIDVTEAMTELTLDVVGRALFGTTLADTADRLRPAVGMGMDTAVGAARLQSVLSLPRWFVDLAGRVVYRVARAAQERAPHPGRDAHDRRRRPRDHRDAARRRGPTTRATWSACCWPRATSTAAP